MTLAVDLMFCYAALAKDVAWVAAWGELTGGDPAACAVSSSREMPAFPKESLQANAACATGRARSEESQAAGLPYMLMHRTYTLSPNLA